MRPTDPPVVLIHGVGLDHSMWLPVMRAMAHRRTVAYDLLGHGAAAKPAGPYSLEMFVDQLAEIVEALGGDVHVVGFSMGALVAQGLALAPSAERIRTMVLLNGVFDRGDDARAAVLERVADVRAGHYLDTIEPALARWFTPGAPPAVVNAVRDQLSGNDAGAYADAYEVFATADRDLAAAIGAIDIPTLVATGADDQRSTVAMALALAAALPNGSAHMLAGLRHLTPLEAPAVVAAMIDGFCRGDR